MQTENIKKKIKLTASCKQRKLSWVCVVHCHQILQMTLEVSGYKITWPPHQGLQLSDTSLLLCLASPCEGIWEQPAGLEESEPY